MLIQPVLRPVLQPVLRSIFDPGIGGGGTPIWTPASLFAGGEQGAWYDPSDFSTMFQDSAGTIPVTAVEQPVGRILDKSGRGNHATQANASNKPILQSIGGKLALVFDGVDDFLSTGSIDFTSTDKMTVVAGVRKLSDAAGGEVVCNNTSTDGNFYLLAPQSASPNYSAGSRGTASAAAFSPSSFHAPRSDVLTMTADIAAPVVALRVSGAQVGTSTATQGTGTYHNAPLIIGRRNGVSLPFNGHIYQLVVRGALTADLAPIEAFAADKTGVTLP